METASCLNCGTPLQGSHCHACGQPVKGLVRPLKNIAYDFLDTVFEYDSRIWRTLVPLYLLPGRITRDYLAGRRMRYVLPFRLFFVLTVVTFLVVQWNLGDTPFGLGNLSPLQRAETVEELDEQLARMRSELAATRAELEADPQRAYGLGGIRAAERAMEQNAEQRRSWLEARDEALAEGREPPPAPGRTGIQLSTEDLLGADEDRFDIPDWFPETFQEQLRRWIERGERNINRLEEEPDRLIRRFFGLLPPVLFVLMPVFALLLKTFYLFHGRLYMEHLVVALHAHSFLGLAVLMGFALNGLHGLAAGGIWLLDVSLGWLAAAAWWWIPIHLYLMQRHVYGQGWGFTLLKFFLISLSYTIVLAIATVIAVIVSVVTA